MVAKESELKDASCRFVLRPNNSASWRVTLLFFLSLCLVSFILAISLAVMGYWMILPFTGLELIAVGVGLQVVSRRCHRCEVITVDEDKVRVESGRNRVEKRWSFSRLWARIVLEAGINDWYPSRLLIQSHGKSMEVGRFLSEDERKDLARELSRAL